MTEAKTKKPTNKKAVALKNLATAKDGQVKKGEECTCTAKEYDIFKKAKAV
tara:strand:+ start:179 stop:331 length:153 start_codon:yes stop_codon:yes gene_type:complete